ncbi:MAG: hypothetical protein A2V77_08055 [Anaeromyxobacter sp. RBG_16_69_14]|nr:MAG: hypothetical protein A2V77_08055 [Anaeromyxobacter sp. RBG_16_69_14]
MSISVAVLGNRAEFELEVEGHRSKELGVLSLAEERFAVKTGSVTLTLEKDGSVALQGGKLELNGTESVLLKAPTITENG